MSTINKDPRASAVETAIEQIKKQFGKGAIMRMGEKTKEKIDVLPTGILALDDALGVGGLPRGRVVEIFGPEASGKTTISLSVIAETQRRGGIAAFIDVEHALDPTWAQILGVNLEGLLISQPDTAEQALEITETLIRSGGVDVVVIDSVAALVPRAEIEGEMGDPVMGMQARLMSQALRKLTGALSKSRTTALFTNQLRQKIGIMFGNPETTPGGLALKFYSSVRIDVRRIQVLKKGEEVIGSRTRIKIIKNKVAPPFRQAEITIAHTGIDELGSLVDLAIQKGIFAKSGSFLKYKNETIAQGVDQARSYLQEHSKLIHEIRSAVLAR